MWNTAVPPLHLGRGNAAEAMVSPAAEAFAESLSTLKFAQRAKGVVVTPQVEMEPEFPWRKQRWKMMETWWKHDV